MLFSKSCSLFLSAVAATAIVGDAAIVNWIDWHTCSHSGGGSPVTCQGTITTATRTIAVTYTNNQGISFFQNGSGTDYFTQNSPKDRNPAMSPFLSAEVSNIPPAAEMIALKYAGPQTLTFSEPVKDLFFAYISLNGNGYGFDQDFNILTSNGSCGYWGCGSIQKQVASGPEYQMLGSGEPHGVIVFRDSFSSLTWRSLTSENWNGMTIGITTSVAEAGPSSSPSVVPSGVPSSIPSGVPSSTPSSAPSGVPSSVPTGVPSFAPSNTPSAVPTEAVKGDPHFKTWSNEKYDYHGVCDLVLLKNPQYKNGLGMNIHLRTKKTRMWSYVASVGVQIGKNTLEVMGGTDENQYWINAVPSKSNNDNDIALSGHSIEVRQLSKHARQFIINLGKDQAIVIKTWNSFVSVAIDGGQSDDFGNSLGLMGTYGVGHKVARDGSTVIDDVNAFGQEWQVLPEEPKLFHNVEGPQAPNKCEIPSASELRRRLGETLVTKEDAMTACSRVSEEDFDLCVFDVMATNDKDAAGAY